jgi:hypothetical protein
MTPRVLTLALFMAALACDSKTEDAAKKDDKKSADAKGGKADAKDAKDAKSDAKADAKPADGAALPTETEVLALDQGESKIPATIEVPKGCTTFNDDPTSIRVEFGEGRERGKLFGVQVKKGNEFNLNLAETEKMMLESKYSKNVILEKTPTMLRWTMQNEGSEPNHKFQMIVDLGGTKWICEDGNHGGFDEAASKRQRDACATLKAT